MKPGHCKTRTDNDQGVAALEFALILPLLVVLFFAGIEYSRFLIVQQKVEKTANILADLVTQNSTATQSGLSSIAAQTGTLIQPLTFSGTVIFTSVTNNNPRIPPCPVSRPCVIWQYRPVGTETSRIGGVGAVPAMPGGYPLPLNQNLIIAELFYKYTPLFSGSATLLPGLAPKTYYYTAVYRPRQGTLTTLTP